MNQKKLEALRIKAVKKYLEGKNPQVICKEYRCPNAGSLNGLKNIRLEKGTGLNKNPKLLILFTERPLLKSNYNCQRTKNKIISSG
ncbi:hypothetical protein ES705_47507 [subsurface metagenome]